MILETPRLTMREISVADTDALSAMLADERVMKHSVNGPMSRDQTAGFVNWCQSHYATNGIGPWAVIEKASGDFVGFAGLSREHIDGKEDVHVGYRLAWPHWGKGIATEAVRAVVDFGIDKALLPIYAIIEPDHLASKRVVEKAGFRQIRSTKFHNKEVDIFVLEAVNR